MPEPKGTEPKGPEQPNRADGRKILQQMVEAYQKAESYADKGQVRLDFSVNGQRGGGPAPFSLAFERPNKLRMDAYGAMVVCDGKDLFASIQDAPEQVMRTPAPSV